MSGNKVGYRISSIRIVRYSFCPPAPSLYLNYLTVDQCLADNLSNTMDNDTNVDVNSLSDDVKNKLAELEIELQDGDITQKGYEKKKKLILERAFKVNSNLSYSIVTYYLVLPIR